MTNNTRILDINLPEGFYIINPADNTFFTMFPSLMFTANPEIFQRFSSLADALEAEEQLITSNERFDTVFTSIIDHLGIHHF